MRAVSSYLEGRSRLITFLSLCLPASVLGEFLLRGNPLVTLLAMVPANTFLRRTFTWNLFTHMFIETDLFMCAVAVCVLQTWGAVAVREWGSVEVAKLLVGINALIGVLVLIISAVTHPHTMWFYEYHCGAAYTLTILIGIVAHLNPEAAVFPAFNEFKARHAPLIWCGFSLLYDLVRKGPTPTEEEAMAEIDVWRGHCAIFTPLVFWLTWFYIRLYKNGAPLHESFFPDHVRGIVFKAGNAIGPVAKVFGISSAGSTSFQTGDGSVLYSAAGHHQGYAMYPNGNLGNAAIAPGAISATPPVTDAAADRKKQIAREALAKRFGQLGQQGGGAGGDALGKVKTVRGASATPPPQVTSPAITTPQDREDAEEEQAIRSVTK